MELTAEFRIIQGGRGQGQKQKPLLGKTQGHVYRLSGRYLGRHVFVLSPSTQNKFDPRYLVGAGSVFRVKALELRVENNIRVNHYSCQAFAGGVRFA